MIGTYRFIQNGEVIAQQDNLITTAGKKALLDFVANYTKQLVGALSVGVGSTAANVADNKLGFEIDRQSVTTNTVDYANSAVVFRATLPQTLVMTIHEVGAQTMDANAAPAASQLILDFNPDYDTWTVGTYVATNSRLGSALQVTAGASTTTTTSLTGLDLDLSGYSALDTFTFATRANNAFVSGVSFRFITSAGNYYSGGTGVLTSGVYTFSTAAKGAMAVTGVPDWASITQIDVLVTATAGGTASVDLDAVRIDDVDAKREDSVLFSRSVLGAPVVKTADLPMDIEYAVTF